MKKAILTKQEKKSLQRILNCGGEKQIISMKALGKYERVLLEKGIIYVSERRYTTRNKTKVLQFMNASQVVGFMGAYNLTVGYVEKSNLDKLKIN